MRTDKNYNCIEVYQTPNGAVEVRFDKKNENFFLTQQQVAQLFGVQKAAISKHIKNIFDTGELTKDSTVSILETVQSEGTRKISRKMEYYNLDLILSIGYRVNSVNATKFRQWATKTLHSHIVDGYTINKKRLAKNYTAFLKAVEQVRSLLPSGGTVGATDALELIKMFASTWFSLDAYDRESLPKTGVTKKVFQLTAGELDEAISDLKIRLINNNQATNLFGTTRDKNGVGGILGNIFQSFDGKDLYPTIEEKAAHLLYFVVKNHPFVDGNKRSGAFAFVWFLKKAALLNPMRITPEALTALTLLVAESNPKDKDRMIGLILLVLK